MVRCQICESNLDQVLKMIAIKYGNQTSQHVFNRSMGFEDISPLSASIVNIVTRYERHSFAECPTVNCMTQQDEEL